MPVNRVSSYLSQRKNLPKRSRFLMLCTLIEIPTIILSNQSRIYYYFKLKRKTRQNRLIKIYNFKLKLKIARFLCEKIDGNLFDCILADLVIYYEFSGWKFKKPWPLIFSDFFILRFGNWCGKCAGFGEFLCTKIFLVSFPIQFC
jgi:hypothetical protein